MAADRRALLRDALRSGRIVRIERRARFGAGRVDGRVVGLSRSLVALAIVGEGIDPNGIQVLRIEDVASTTIERAL